MADYTLELRKVVEIVGPLNVGLNEYPIFDESYRDSLNQKILDHYWYNEIAHESIDMFIHQLKVKMNEIMPFYNQLYESELIDFDPMVTHDVHSTGDSTQDTTQDMHTKQNAEQTLSSDSRVSSSEESKARTVQSQMPQTRLSGHDDYATAANDTSSKGSGQNHSNSATQDQQKRTSDTASTTGTKAGNVTRSWGYNTPKADLLQKWRETFLNIDMSVISELGGLFMQIRSSGDEYVNGWGYGLY